MLRLAESAAVGVVIALALACQTSVEPVNQIDDAAGTAPSPTGPDAVVTVSDAAMRRMGLEIVPVDARDVPLEITVPGQVRPNADRTVRVASYINGIVTECCRGLGEVVQEGDTLVILHTHQTHDLLAEYRQAVAELRASESERGLAEEVFRREARLLELKVSSVARVDAARTALRRVEAAVEAADAAVEASIAHLEYLVSEVPPAIRNRESGPMPDFDVAVRAPMRGTIVERAVTPGDVVSPTDELYRITDLTTVWAVAQVPEEHLAELHLDMDATVHVRAFPDRPFPARVTHIASDLDPDSRTVQVRASVDNPGGALKTGMYATIALRSRDVRRTLVVPEAAVQHLAEDAFVFRPLGDGRFRPQPVTLGRTVDSHIEIVSGVVAGESVVAHGSFLLKAELLRSEMVAE